MNRVARTACVAVLLVACGGGQPDEEELPPPPVGFEPPVLTNPEPPVRYPAELFADRVEGVVLLFLFIDSTGTLVTDSARVHESSGNALLDSAALAGVGDFRFAPARRDGKPISTGFIQPVHFRHPDLAAVGENP